MAKRKRSKSGNSSKILTYMAWGLAIVAIALSSLVAGYYLGFENAKKETSKQSNVEKEKRLALLKKLEKSAKETKNITISPPIKKAFDFNIFPIILD